MVNVIPVLFQLECCSNVPSPFLQDILKMEDKGAALSLESSLSALSGAHHLAQSICTNPRLHRIVEGRKKENIECCLKLLVVEEVWDKNLRQDTGITGARILGFM